MVIQFIADLFPASNLLPADPVARARVRHSIQTFDTTFISAFEAVIYGGASPDKVVAALDAFQKRLPETGFAIGEWSLADVAAAPWVALTLSLLEHDVGKYPAGEGLSAAETLRGAEFARLNKYVKDVKARPSFQVAWNEVRAHDRSGR